jgi:hypothetical protein
VVIKKIKNIILNVFILFLLGPLSSAEAVGIETGEEVPDFTLSAVEGGLVKLSEQCRGGRACEAQ